jgi:hypothetical protein
LNVIFYEKDRLFVFLFGSTAAYSYLCRPKTNKHTN